jgi:hypothetical protein
MCNISDVGRTYIESSWRCAEDVSTFFTHWISTYFSLDKGKWADLFLLLLRTQERRYNFV